MFRTHELSIRPMILSCPDRHESLAETIRSWDATDWPGRPSIVMDLLDSPARSLSMVFNSQRLLAEFLSGWGEYLLFIEDDVEFNQFLFHNLQTWQPLTSRSLAIGSIYHSPDCAPAHQIISHDTFAADLKTVGGSQALLIRRDAVERSLQRWDEFLGMNQDLRIFHALADREQLICHMPGLVQHRPVASTWGGRPHQSSNFKRHFAR